MTIHSLEQPIRVDRPIETHTGFALAHDRQDGEVSRLFMNVWCEVRGIAGKLGRNATAGELALAGTLFAEQRSRARSRRPISDASLGSASKATPMSRS